MKVVRRRRTRAAGRRPPITHRLTNKDSAPKTDRDAAGLTWVEFLAWCRGIPYMGDEEKGEGANGRLGEWARPGDSKTLKSRTPTLPHPHTRIPTHSSCGGAVGRRIIDVSLVSFGCAACSSHIPTGCCSHRQQFCGHDGRSLCLSDIPETHRPTASRGGDIGGDGRGGPLMLATNACNERLQPMLAADALSFRIRQ